MNKILNFKSIISVVIIGAFIFIKDAASIQKSENNKEGLSILFIMDCSGSMKDDNKLEDAKKAAQRTINRLNGLFEIAVIAFFDCDRIRVLQDFTDNKQAVINTILGLSPDSATPLADALVFGSEYLMKNAKYENKSLIVLTDGIETCGGNPNTCLPLPSTKEKEEEKEYPSDLI